MTLPATNVARRADEAGDPRAPGETTLPRGTDIERVPDGVAVSGYCRTGQHRLCVLATGCRPAGVDCGCTVRGCACSVPPLVVMEVAA